MALALQEGSYTLTASGTYVVGGCTFSYGGSHSFSVTASTTEAVTLPLTGTKGLCPIQVVP